jgi:hypothetical protein
MEPPSAPDGGVSLCFPHGDWAEDPGFYAVDIRKAGPSFREEWQDLTDAGDPKCWFFDIAKECGERAELDLVEICFTGVDGVPAEYDLMFVDRDLHQVVDLRESGRYLVQMDRRSAGAAPERSRFAVLVGTEEAVTQRAAALAPAPLATSLCGIFPNPFHRQARISYDLAQPAEVRVRIFDVSGRVIWSTSPGAQRAGSQELLWDGKNNSGNEAATGTYFLELRAGDYTGRRKINLVRSRLPCE